MHFNFIPEYAYDAQKSALLKQQRGISFEDITALMEDGSMLYFKRHPNQTRYPNQFLCAVNVHGYVHIVPVVIEGNRVFLKTIYPSRKATKGYARGVIQ